MPKSIHNMKDLSTVNSSIFYYASILVKWRIQTIQNNHSHLCQYCEAIHSHYLLQRNNFITDLISIAT